MQTYHLIGIGGIGMSALAKLLLEKGHLVTGSDSSSGIALERLRQMGATVYPCHKEIHIDKSQVVVYSSSIKEDNIEMQAARALSLPIYHRSELLDQLMQDQKALLITGAHGKTSTTALLSTLLLDGGFDPSFVVGGYIQSLKTNSRGGKGEYFVAEADESDGSFLRSKGFGAIVTNVEEDHLDYWHTRGNLFAAYEKFIHQVKNKERLFLCGEDPFLTSLKLDGYYYGFSNNHSLQIIDYHQKGWSSFFSLRFQGKQYGPFSLPLQGVHYVLNATAAIGMALKLGVDVESIKKTLLTYQGVKRRLELVGEIKKIKIFDDYAHHPTEIQTTIKGLKDAASPKRLIIVFQPHRYTRLQHLLLEFAESFSLADHCIITEVYGAGESAIDGIDSDLLVATMKRTDVVRVNKESLIEYLKDYIKADDVILMMGAGDITQYPYLLLKELSK